MAVIINNNSELLKKNTGKLTSEMTVKENSVLGTPKALVVSANNAKIKQVDLITFTTQLSVMLDSGVVLMADIVIHACVAGSCLFWWPSLGM